MVSIYVYNYNIEAHWKSDQQGAMDEQTKRHKGKPLGQQKKRMHHSTRRLTAEGWENDLKRVYSKAQWWKWERIRGGNGQKAWNPVGKSSKQQIQEDSSTSERRAVFKNGGECLELMRLTMEFTF